MDQVALFHAQRNQQENLTQDWVQRHRSNSQDDEDDESHRGLASRLYLLCLGLLRQRVFLQQKSSKKGSNALREELGKFYLWGNELADGKLDQALGYSEDIESEVLDLLRNVGRSLLQAYSSSNAINESALPEDNRQELSGLIDQAQAVTSSKGLKLSHSDVGESSGSDTEDEDEIESGYDGLLVRKLAQQTNWLRQLSTAIEQNYIRARLRQKRNAYPPVVPFAVSGPAQFYVGLVQDKFQKARRKLVERLGEANWQRHVNIRNQLDSETSAAEEPAAHSLFRPHSAFHDSGIGTSVPTHTTYAASHTSFRSSASESARGSIRVPPTPVEVATGQSFQCFLCKAKLSNIKSRIDWKMHVFSDLQPYICTFPDCPNELAQFPSRAAWAEHEFSQHRILQSWKCPECHEKYASDSDWEHHVHMQHKLKLAGKDLQIAKNMALVVEKAMRVDGEACPLCHTVLYEARRGYVKHVGTHMEEIALITLPRDIDEDEDQAHEQSDGDSVADFPSGALSKAMNPNHPNFDPARIQAMNQQRLLPQQRAMQYMGGMPGNPMSQPNFFQGPNPQLPPHLQQQQEVTLLEHQQALFAQERQIRATQQQRARLQQQQQQQQQRAMQHSGGIPGNPMTQPNFFQRPDPQLPPHLQQQQPLFTEQQHKQQQQQAQPSVNSTTTMTMSEHDQHLYQLRVAVADNDSENQAERTQQSEDAEVTESREDDQDSMYAHHGYRLNHSPKLPSYNNSELQSHLQKLEKLEKQVGDEESQERLEEKSLVEAGNERQRGNKSRLKCPHCSKTYFREGYLKRHVAKHVTSGSFSVPGAHSRVHAAAPLQAPSRPSPNQSHLASEAREMIFAPSIFAPSPDSISRTQTSKRERPLVEAKDLSSESSLVPPYSVSLREGEAEAPGQPMQYMAPKSRRSIASASQLFQYKRDPITHQLVKVPHTPPGVRGGESQRISSVSVRSSPAAHHLRSPSLRVRSPSAHEQGPHDLPEADSNPFTVPNGRSSGASRRTGPLQHVDSSFEDESDREDRKPLYLDDRSIKMRHSSPEQADLPHEYTPAVIQQSRLIPAATGFHHCLAGGGCDYFTKRHTDLERHYKAKHLDRRKDTLQEVKAGNPTNTARGGSQSSQSDREELKRLRVQIERKYINSDISQTFVLAEYQADVSRLHSLLECIRRKETSRKGH